MALFGGGDTVPREFYERERERADRAEADVRAFTEKFGTIVTQVIEIKRADAGLPPADSKQPDVTSLIGRRTNAAIEEFAAGDAELRRLLIARSVSLTEALKAEHGENADMEAIDEQVAAAVEAGDTE